MEIEISTPALLFPAISLLLLYIYKPFNNWTTYSVQSVVIKNREHGVMKETAVDKLIT